MRSPPVALLGLVLVGASWSACRPFAPTDASDTVTSPPPFPAAWIPPTWFPEPERPDLWILDDLDGPSIHRGGPRIRSLAAIVADLDRGEILFARDPDTPRGIASVTKLVSALTLSSLGPDLDRELCVGLDQWPSRPGARSKFETGDCHAGWEFLGAALVGSDNRGAFAFPALAETDYYVFVDRMHGVAWDLGLRRSSFGDPAGLQDENRASARDMLKAVTAVTLHPSLSMVASAHSWQIEPSRGMRRLNTTNQLLKWGLPEFDTLAAKTGYTDTAKYCFATVVQSQATGRRYGAVVLAAPTNGSRFSDVAALVRWADEP